MFFPEGDALIDSWVFENSLRLKVDSNVLLKILKNELSLKKKKPYTKWNLRSSWSNQEVDINENNNNKM